MTLKEICSRTTNFSREKSNMVIIACKLDNFRLSNANNITVGHLDINSQSGKFDQLKLLITNKTDVLILTEIKLDNQIRLIF